MFIIQEGEGRREREPRVDSGGAAREERDILEAKVARLEREKEEERGGREAAEVRERVANEELAKLKKKN